MRLNLRRRAAAPVLVAAVTALVAQSVAATNASAQGEATPWAGSDNLAVGGLTFYNAAGNVITSGSTNSAPFAAYVVGRADTRAGDTRASLTVFTPEQGNNPGAWSKSTLLGPSAGYPNASAPAAVAASSFPVYTGGAVDYTLDDHVDAYPQTSATPGYVKTYEVRLSTTFPGKPVATSYDYADITIDSAAHTWSLVYTPGSSPVQATAPAAPTNVLASPKNASADVSWTAPTDGGSPITGYDVQYSSNGGTDWTSAADAFHTSTLTSHTITGLTNGTSYVFRVAAINAVGQGAYSSASTAVVPAVPVTATTSALTIAAPTSVKYGTPVTVTGKLTDSGHANAAITGASVSLYRKIGASTTYVYATKTTTTSTGTLSFKLAGLTSTTSYQWRYAGSSTHKAVNSATKAVTAVPVISAHRSVATVKLGGTIKVYGTVSPSSVNAIVYLQRLSAGKWVTGTSVKIVKQKLPNGTTTVGFVVSSKPTTRGTVTYRIYKKATTTLGAATSNTTSVKVT